MTASGFRPVALCILDGWGLSDAVADNAVAQARTPAFDAIWADGARTTLSASGLDVGLPKGQMGNSEVGHMNIGAGRVVMMDLPKIDASIESGDFAQRPALRAFLDQAQSGEVAGVVHLIGLISTGGVHAHQRHFVAAARAIAAAGLGLRLHLLLDGRDTPPKSALADVDAVEAALADLPDVAVATVIGRYFALDRDKRWDRVETAYRAIVEAASAAPTARDARAAVAAAYARGETDEFVQATVIEGYQGAAIGDSLMMTHFRADRAREILSALTEPDFDGFARGAAPKWRGTLGMVSYSDALDQRLPALFPPEALEDTLGDYVAKLGLPQFRVAETEKYPHVTFFFNGGVETPNAGEARRLEPSPKVATYDLAPEMSAEAVGDAFAAAIRSGDYALLVCNFANPDMVGHSGDLAATIRAVEAADAGLAKAVAAIRAVGGAMLATADHGNAEQMRDPVTGEPHTAHTTNPVPLILVDARPGAPAMTLAPGGRLADIAPSLLALMGLEQPAAMTGHSLLLEP